VCRGGRGRRGAGESVQRMPVERLAGGAGEPGTPVGGERRVRVRAAVAVVVSVPGERPLVVDVRRSAVRVAVGDEARRAGGAQREGRDEEEDGRAPAPPGTSPHARAIARALGGRSNAAPVPALLAAPSPPS
jgi:hypothetical protein